LAHECNQRGLCPRGVRGFRLLTEADAFMLLSAWLAERKVALLRLV